MILKTTLDNLIIISRSLVFSETWLQEFNCNLYGLNGYTIVERHRLTPDGGVEVCILDNVNFMERQDLELFAENMESVYVEINKS